MIVIREEVQKDYDLVRIVNDQAFGQSEEGRIVDNIRKACKQTLPLAAVSDEKNSRAYFLQSSYNLA